MSKLFFASIIAILTFVIVGCQPRMDQVEYSTEEQAWQRVIRDNYPGYRPPATPPRAVYDNTLKKEASLAPIQNPEAPPPPANDPVAEDVKSQDAPVVKEIPVANVKQETPVAKATPAPKEVVSDKPVVAGKPVATVAPIKPVKVETTKVEPPDPTDSIVYVVKSGDTLGSLAKRFYGDARRQDIIRRANLDLVSNPNRLYPGMKLFIPKL